MMSTFCHSARRWPCFLISTVVTSFFMLHQSQPSFRISQCRYNIIMRRRITCTFAYCGENGSFHSTNYVKDSRKVQYHCVTSHNLLSLRSFSCRKCAIHCYYHILLQQRATNRRSTSTTSSRTSQQKPEGIQQAQNYGYEQMSVKKQDKHARLQRAVTSHTLMHTYRRSLYAAGAAVVAVHLPQQLYYVIIRDPTQHVCYLNNNAYPNTNEVSVRVSFCDKSGGKLLIHEPLTQN